MAPQPELRERRIIINGPSKLDLMLALYVTDQGIRVVSFKEYLGKEFKVEIISAKRVARCGDIWDLRGIAEIDGQKWWVDIEYLTNRRCGNFLFICQADHEPVDDSDRSRTLQVIIDNLAARYRAERFGGGNGKILFLLDMAKKVNQAIVLDELSEVLNELNKLDDL